MHVWEAPPATLLQTSLGKKRGNSCPLSSQAGFTAGGTAVPHVSQWGTAMRTVCPSPTRSPPLGQKLCSRCSRLGALRRICSCAEGTAPRREGWGVKPRAATAPPAVPSQKVGCYSGTSQFSLSVLVPGNKGPVQAERQALCSAKRLTSLATQ